MESNSKTSDNEDHSELFEEDNECTLSFSHESLHSRSASAIHKVRHADRISSAVSSEMKRDAGTCRDSSSKFRVAVKKVQTMQAVTKTFSNSQQMREAVYEDWLARKLALLQKSERLKHEERMEKEAALKRKATTRAERSKTTVQQWHKQKELELMEKRKQLAQQTKQKQQEDGDEKDRKKRDSSVMFSQWKKQKTQVMMEQHRQRKREEEKAKQEKEAESKERIELSKKVIQSWNQQKDKAAKENATGVREEKKQKQKLEAAQKMTRAEESDRACNAWLAKKKKLRKEDSLRSQPDPKPAWCPARTLHTVPPNRLTRIQLSRRQSLSSQQTETGDNYSVDSFSSAEDDAADPGSQADLNSTTPDSSMNCTGRVKTVKVCCKTLKYLCNCDT